MCIETSPELAKFINELDIKIVSNGYAELDSKWNYGYNKSPYSRVYVTVNGCGEVSDEHGNVYKLVPGEICFIPAGANFKYRCDSFMTQIFFHVNYIKSNGLDLFDDYSKIHILRSPFSESDISRENFFEPSISIATRYMWVITYTACEVISAGELKDVAAKSYSPIIEKAVHRICETKSVKLSIAEIADELYISQSMLSRKFKEEIGIPFGTYVDKLIFNDAKRDISTGKYSIKEVSVKYGFCDEFYFSRRFKQLFGLSPSLYKKQVLRFWPC